MASFAFRVEGIGPDSDPVWRLVDESVRRAYWRAVVGYVLEAKDRELASGLDRFGVPLLPIAASTRARGRMRSHTGLGSAGNPPLTPAGMLSRTRSLLTGRAMDGYAEFYWTADDVTGLPWGQVLGWHREGAGRLPVRDVIGLAPKSLAEVKARAHQWWVNYKAGHPVFDHEGKIKLQVGHGRMGKIPLDGRTDLGFATLGAGASKGTVEAAIKGGTFTGFRQLGDRPKPASPRPKGLPPKPVPPKPVPPKPVPPKPVPPKPVPPKAGADAASEAKAAAEVAPVLPGRPLAERLAADTASARLTARVADLGADSLARVGRYQELKAEKDRLVAAFAASGNSPNFPGRARLVELIKDLPAVGKAARDAQDRARKGAHDLLKATVADPLAIVRTSATAGRGGVAHVPLTDRARDRSDEALGWLSSVTARGGQGPRFEVGIGGFPAHMQDQRSAEVPGGLQVMMSAEAGVVEHVHELGHVLEDRIPGLTTLARDFLRARVADEVPVRMADVAPGQGYGPGETGRKDRFDEVFSTNQAYYIGKDYADGGTEVVAMGLQKIYENPAFFAAKDPEYFRFMVGILNGSLR